MVRIDEVSPRRESHTLSMWKTNVFTLLDISSKKLYFCLSNLKTETSEYERLR